MIGIAKCVKPNHYGQIFVGKIYEIHSIRYYANTYDYFVLINGKYYWYPEGFFEMVDDIRNRLIDEILK